MRYHLVEAKHDEVIRTARGAAEKFTRTLRLFPPRFWLLVAATFAYLAAIGLGFPYTSLFLCSRFHVSVAVVGLVLGGAALAGLPLQVVGGHLSDRCGRRPVLIVSALATITLYVGLAFVTQLWQAALLILCERSLGWPMFLQGCNAMIADLVPDKRRAEAFGFWRLATMAGVVVGPALAGAALAAGAEYRQLFLAAGAACGLFLLVALFGLTETRPAAGAPGAAGGRRRKRGAATAGYRLVLADRRFLAFCAVALLPLFCYGQLYSTFPVMLTGTLGLSSAAWGLLLALYAALVVVLQYPVVRFVRRYDRVTVLAWASAFIGIGIGGSAFTVVGWPLALLMVSLCLGEVLLSPLSSTIVATLAAPEVRGRYVGVWTLVWTFGMALGPTFGGVMMTTLGARGSYAFVLVAGLAGALLFPMLRPARRPLAPAFRRAKR